MYVRRSEVCIIMSSKQLPTLIVVEVIIAS